MKNTDDEKLLLKLDKAVDLYIKIKSLTLELNILKNEIKDDLRNLEKLPKNINAEKASIKIYSYLTAYKHQLKKSFVQLDIKKKRELYKQGLLKITFRLNAKKYEEMKQNGVESDIDQFVIKRTPDSLMLAININDNIKKEIENEYLKHLGLGNMLTRIQNDEDDIMIEEMIKDELERDPFEFVDEEK